MTTTSSRATSSSSTAYTILHSRTGFVDGDRPHQKRHMLRLWLKFPTPWPLSAEFPAHMGYQPAQDTPILVEAEA